MSNSPTQLVNFALAKIGAKLYDSIENEPLPQLIYDQSLAALLRRHPWNFALKVENLAEVTLGTNEAKPEHFTKKFDLPGDFGKLVTVEQDQDQIAPHNFGIYGRELWTIYSTPVLTYVQTEPAESTFPPDFIEAFTSLMASRLAERLLQSQEVANRWFQMYETVDLPTAIKNDARDTPGSMMTNYETARQSSPLLLTRRSRRGSRFVDPRYLEIE